MSSSSPAPVTLSVSADPTTETFIIDHSFRMVERGVGAFSVQLTPGLYKLKFRRGTALAELHQEFAPGSPPVQLSAPVLASSSAVPLRGSHHVSDEQLNAAQQLSTRPAIRRGKGSFVFLFVRAEGSWAPGAAGAATCLSLRALSGETLVNLATDGTFSDTSSTTGLVVELDPGAYLIHARCDAGAFQQIVVTSLGWTTQLFFMCTPTSRGAPNSPPQPGLRLEDTSVLMSKGAFNASDPLLHFAEAARIALSNQQISMPRKLIQDLVWDKFESPMLGVYAAHALNASIERQRATQDTGRAAEDRALLTKVLQVLQDLIPNHPDVLALSSPQVRRTIAVPPMLRSSWALVVGATLHDHWELETQSFAARLPASLMGGTPWLIWNENALLPLSQTPGPEVSLAALEQRVNQLSALDEAPRDLELSESEEAIYSFLYRRARLGRRSPSKLESTLDELGLARAFGTTLPEVKQAIGGLATKLSSSK